MGQHPARRNGCKPLVKYCLYNYRPQRSWGKVMFSQACVILFTGGGLPQCMLGYQPPGPGTPLGLGTPPRTRHPQHPPGSRHPPRTRHPPDQAHSPGSRHPPTTEHAGRCGQRAGGMYPTGMQTCLV